MTGSEQESICWRASKTQSVHELLSFVSFKFPRFFHVLRGLRTIANGTVNLTATCIGKLAIGTKPDRFGIIPDRIAVVFQVALSVTTEGKSASQKELVCPQRF